MLDVDIVGQLVPNPATMIVQLCSTLVLFLLIKKYLWPSIERFLNSRKEKMQKDLRDSEEAKQLALKDRQLAQEELNKAGSKGKQIVEAATSQAEYEKQQILKQANQEAESLRLKAQEQIAQEKAAMVSQMQKEMVEIAILAAGKVLGSENGEQIDQKAIDAFVKDATENEQ